MAEAAGAQGGLIHRVWHNSAFRYLFAGGTAFVVDAGMLAIFRELLGWQVWLATGVAFVLSFFFTYFIQRIFAFGSDLPHGKALFRYIVLVAFNTLATMGIVSLIALTPLGWFAGKVMATGATTVWNFFIYRAWVFPPAMQTTPEGAAAIAAEEADFEVPDAGSAEDTRSDAAAADSIPANGDQSSSIEG